MSAAPSALTTATTELVTPVYRSAVTISCQLAGARGTHFVLYLVAIAATIPRSQARLILGTGGDNSRGAVSTWFEGAMVSDLFRRRQRMLFRKISSPRGTKSYLLTRLASFFFEI